MEAQIAVELLLDRLDHMKMVEGSVYPPLPGSLGHQPIPAHLFRKKS
jgi:hypothetical protein